MPTSRVCPSAARLNPRTPSFGTGHSEGARPELRHTAPGVVLDFAGRRADPFLLAELEVAEGAGEQVQVRAGESSDGGQHHVATGV